MSKRTILAIEAVTMHTPSRWRDLVEVRLDCGHVGRHLRLARLRGADRDAPHAGLVGQEIDCRRCRTEERLRRPAGRRRRSPAIAFPAPKPPFGFEERRLP